MNRHLPSTHIQNKLFGYIPLLQISFYCFLHVSLGRRFPLFVFSGRLKISLRTSAHEIIGYSGQMSGLQLHTKIVGVATKNLYLSNHISIALAHEQRL
jgi:hypothetical protein